MVDSGFAFPNKLIKKKKKKKSFEQVLNVLKLSSRFFIDGEKNSISKLAFPLSKDLGFLLFFFIYFVAV